MENISFPVLALRGKMVYPGTSVFFEVSRAKSLKALEEAINHNQQIFLLNQKDPAVEKPEKRGPLSSGNTGKNPADGESRTGNPAGICGRNDAGQSIGLSGCGTLPMGHGGRNPRRSSPGTGNAGDGDFPDDL